MFKIPLLRGRTFNERDLTNSAKIVVINQEMAKKYWPKADPIGAVITIGKGLGPQFEDPPRQVISIVGELRETGLGDTNVGVMYLPQSQVPEGLAQLANSALPLAWPMRSTNDPNSIRTAVQREFRSRRTNADLENPHDERGDRAGSEPATLQHAVTEYLRRYCAGLGRYRHLWPHVLHG